MWLKYQGQRRTTATNSHWQIAPIKGIWQIDLLDAFCFAIVRLPQKSGCEIREMQVAGR